MNEGPRIGILGGTGFVGRVLCRQLLEGGYRPVVLTRSARAHADLEQQGDLRLLEGDTADARFLAHALTGCEVVVNLIGILNEQRRGDFQQVHVAVPRVLGRVCKSLGTTQVLHMSALGARAGSSPSRYLRSKGEGGNALQVELGGSVPWTIFRPSVIFGPGDAFTNRFAQLLRRLPWAFPLACPQSRFAPVHVEDVAAAMVTSIGREASRRARYALCGPAEFTLEEIVAYLGKVSGHPRRILALPDRLARLQARILERVPGKPFTHDNYLSLQVDSVWDDSAGDRDGFAELGIAPSAMEGIVPQYLNPPSGE
ncbi:MAG: complex I NDUFA9 subunit family protein [Salinisphaera sp.]|nr:complex I NDUFA9 subunit family protein [Salinisphaera sp.]